MTCDSPKIQRIVFVSVNSDPQLKTTDFSIQEFASGEEQQEQQPLQLEQEKLQDLYILLFIFIIITFFYYYLSVFLFPFKHLVFTDFVVIGLNFPSYFVVLFIFFVLFCSSIDMILGQTRGF